MEVVINQDVAVWEQYTKYIQTSFRKTLDAEHKSSIKDYLFLIPLFLAFFFFSGKIENFNYPTLILSSLFFLLLIVFFIYKLVSYHRKLLLLESPDINGTFCGEHKYTFSEQFITVELDGYKGQLEWQRVLRVVRESGLIMIFIDTLNAYIFPENKLDNPLEFYSVVSSYHENSK